MLLIIGGVFYYVEKNKQPQHKEDSSVVVNKYTAYIKINPAIRLDYSQTCTKDEKESLVCQEPIVDNYTLINEDAEDIYEDVDLFSKGKTLDKVIEVICAQAEEKNIDTKSIEITSDWSEINTYIQESAKTEETRNYSVEVKPKEKIVEQINNDERQEEENKTTTTTTTTTKKASVSSDTIDLNQGVTYDHNMFTYRCDKCFSESLLSSLRNVKGTCLMNASDSEITIKYITVLSEPYNTKTYKGTSPISKIEAAGGEQVGGAGGSDEPLTSAICKEYNLKCK